jgi:hypothetical protein
MTRAEPRTLEQRKADTLAKLAEPALDGWVTSTPSTGRAHMVPLSLYWTGDRLVIAVEKSSLTARNILATTHARVGVGGTRDVVLMDLVLEESVAAAQAPAEIGDGYAGQSDWDPRDDPSEYLYLVLRPTRVLAWREANELSGRVLMRDGAWLV